MTALVPSARSLFDREVARPDDRIDLGRAALLVAKEEYPQLPVERYLVRLDHLAEEVKDRLAGEEAPTLVFRELVDLLYSRHGFRGNREEYYDPRNSFLNDVLDRRTGIPLTLGLVILEVGRRVGLPLSGVNFPGHFLVRFRGEALGLLVDPFDQGRILFEDQGQELLDRVYGGMVRVQPAFLADAGPLEIIERLLRNLKGIYLNRKDHARALGVVERLLLVRPDQPRELRDLGTLLARGGRPQEAVEPLERYLAVVPGASDARRVRALIAEIQAGRNPAAPDAGGGR